MSNFLTVFKFISWRNAVEIIIISFLLYSASKKLKSNSHPKLLAYFYTYCMLILTTFWLELPILHQFLWFVSPTIVTLFVILNRTIIEKNFAPAIISHSNYQDWPKKLIRHMLIARNNKNFMRIIIEHNSNLEEYLNAPFILNTHFQSQLLTMLMEGKQYEDKKFVWIKNTGNLVAVNVSINVPEINIQQSTDATIIITSDEHSGFTVISGKNEPHNLSTENCLKFLLKKTQKNLKGSTKYHAKKENRQNIST